MVTRVDLASVSMDSALFESAGVVGGRWARLGVAAGTGVAMLKEDHFTIWTLHDTTSEPRLINIRQTMMHAIDARVSDVEEKKTNKICQSDLDREQARNDPSDRVHDGKRTRTGRLECLRLNQPPFVDSTNGRLKATNHRQALQLFFF